MPSGRKDFHNFRERFPGRIKQGIAASVEHVRAVEAEHFVDEMIGPFGGRALVFVAPSRATMLAGSSCLP